MHRGEAAARQFTHPAGGRVNAQLPFRADGNWLLPPIRSTCMRKRGTTSLFCRRCINSARRYAARRACQLKGSARMGVNFSAVRRYSPALRSAILRACDDPGILRHLHSFILTMLHTISGQRATFIFIITLLCLLAFQPSPGPRRGSPRSGRGAEPAQYVKQAKRTDSAGQTGPAGSDSDAGNAG